MDRDRIKERISRDIERDGWSTIGVFAAPGDEPPAPPFSYSVGFREHGQPEIIVMGIPPDYAHQIIANIFHLVKNGLELHDGLRLSEGLDDNYEVEFRALPADGTPLNMAKVYYEVDELPALQLVWPDVDRRFPGEEGCDESTVREQDIGVLRAYYDRLDEEDAQKDAEGANTEQQTAALKRAQLSDKQLAALERMKVHTDFNDLATKSALGREGLERQVKVEVGRLIREASEKRECTQEKKHAEEQKPGRAARIA